MIFVPMGQEHTDNGLFSSVFRQRGTQEIRAIRQEEVDSQHAFIGEAQATVDNQDLVFIFIHIHIARDIFNSSKRQECDGVHLQ